VAAQFVRVPGLVVRVVDVRQDLLDARKINLGGTLKKNLALAARSFRFGRFSERGTASDCTPNC